MDSAVAAEQHLGRHNRRCWSYSLGSTTSVIGLLRTSPAALQMASHTLRKGRVALGDRQPGEARDDRYGGDEERDRDHGCRPALARGLWSLRAHRLASMCTSGTDVSERNTDADREAVVDRGQHDHEANPKPVAIERRRHGSRRMYRHAEAIFGRLDPRLRDARGSSTVMNSAADTTRTAPPITDATTESARGAMAGFD